MYTKTTKSPGEKNFNESKFPKDVYEFADGDPDRARALWIKIRLIEAFPVNFEEIDLAYKNDKNDRANAYPSPLVYIPPDRRRYQAAYKTAIDARISPVKNKRVKGKSESAICLYLALSQTRSGVSHSIDMLRPYCGDVDAFNDIPTPDGELEFIDGWNEPLRFYRFATSNGNLQSKAPNSGMTLSVSGRTLSPLDPLDPKGRLLLNKDGNIWTNSLSGKPVADFVDKKFHLRNAGTGSTFTAWYAVPIIVSAGPNVSKDTTPQLGFPNGYAGYRTTGLKENIESLRSTVGAQEAYQDMSVVTSLDEADNVYSIPLR